MSNVGQGQVRVHGNNRVIMGCVGIFEFWREEGFPATVISASFKRSFKHDILN